MAEVLVFAAKLAGFVLGVRELSVETLDGGEGDAIGIDGGDGGVVVAEGEGGAEVLGSGAEVGDVLGSVKLQENS